MQLEAETKPAVSMDADNLLVRLSSKNLYESSAAEEVLRHLGPQIVESLLQALREEARRRRRRRAALVGIPLLTSGIILAGVLLFTRSWTHGFVYSLWTGVGVFHYLWGMARFKNLIAGKTAGVLAKYEDLRAIGPLIEAMECPDPDVRVLATLALTRLLPRLKPSDADLVNEQQYACLCRALKSRDSDLVLSILQAMEQIGDRRALPLVERLARSRGRTERIARIRTAAQECLPRLRERLERERPGEHLLRPAESPTELLLRPAQDALAADPKNLLHPAALHDGRPGD